MQQLDKPQDLPSECLPVTPGLLDDVTMMRYAHIYRERTSGGMERYLQVLNQGLLQRNRLTVLQTYLTTDGRDNDVEIEKVGIGCVLWVPVVALQMDPGVTALPRRLRGVYGRAHRLCKQQGMGSCAAALASLRSLWRYNAGHLRYPTTIFSDHLAGLLVKHRVQLLALHWLSYDTGALISGAVETGVPFVFINHFDNARLSMPTTQKSIAGAAGIGTVSNANLPKSAGARYLRLSDAVDTEFFSVEKAKSAPVSAHPIVLLPARIDSGKGHADLIEAARILMAKRVDLMLCFAGAVHSESVHQELRRSAAAVGLQDRVFFLGEQSQEELRDWYARSSVVVLPSHSEGLGRVLLEAQAMQKPVVAYDCGGMVEALLPDRSGYLVKTGEARGLAEKIAFLLENKTRSLRMGECGRDFVTREFSVSALIERHEVFYLRALSAARRG